MNFLKKKEYLLIKMPKIFKEKVQFIKINYKVKNDLLKKLFRVCKNKEYLNLRFII